MKTKMVILLLTLTGMCGSGWAQCTLTVGTSNLTDTSTITDAATGGVDFSTLMIRGGGTGPIDPLTGQLDHRGYNFASESISGGFDRRIRLTSLGGNGTRPETGFLAVSSGRPVFTKFSVDKWNNTYTLTGAYGYRQGATWSWIVQNSWTIPDPALNPIWLDFVRSSSGVYTLYVSWDNVSWPVFASGFAPPGTDPTLVGIYADAGTMAAGAYGQATFDNMVQGGVIPVLTDADYGNTGGNVGDGEPVVPFAFTETASGALTYTPSGPCNSAQQNAITSAEANGSYQLYTSIFVFDVATNNIVASTASHGPSVCANCSTSAFDTVLTTGAIWTNATLGYRQDFSVGPSFDSVFSSTLANANVLFSAQNKTVEWVDVHAAITKGYVESVISPPGPGGVPPGVYHIGGYPNFACTTRSIPPDFKIYAVVDPSPPTLYYKGRSMCKRPQGTTVGGWQCTGSSSWTLGIKKTNDSTYIDCTNWDLGIFPKWP